MFPYKATAMQKKSKNVCNSNAGYFLLRLALELQNP
jgi:hypothetical protein